jgi:hypothetical protein
MTVFHRAAFSLLHARVIGARVVAALAMQTAGRHRKRDDREKCKNRAFHVRRFLFGSKVGRESAENLDLC